MAILGSCIGTPKFVSDETDELVDKVGEFQRKAVEIWKSDSTIPKQHELSETMYKFKADEYEERMTSMRGKIRFQCARAPKAGLWITALPDQRGADDIRRAVQVRDAVPHRRTHLHGRAPRRLLQVHKDAGPARRARDDVRQLQQRDEATT